MLRDYLQSKGFGWFYRVNIIFNLEKEGKKEFQRVYYFAPGLSAVVRQSGNKSQVSAAELCSLF